MKILMLIDSFTVGGAQKQFCILAKELHKKYDLTVVVYHSLTSHFEEDLITEGVRIVRIIKKSRYDVAFIIKLIKFIRKEQFDVSISFLDTPNFYNVIAKLTGSINKIIVSQRSAYFKESISLRKRVQESLMYFADVITTNSVTQKERMEKIFPFMRKKIYYLPNAYASIKADNSINNRKQFIVLSNTQNNKNPYMLCKALVEYKKLYGEPKFRILWFGRISQSKKDIRNLNEGIGLLSRYGIQESLTFEGITENPEKIIKVSDLLIHISNYEGCPNSVCEAMLYRVPVMVSNVCDAPYLLNNSRGILVDQNSPEDIAIKIKEFELMEDIQITKMTAKAHQYITSNFNISTTIGGLITLIND